MTLLYEDNSTLLTPGAFDFVLDSELKRAVRSQSSLTLVAIETRRESPAGIVTTDDTMLQEVARLIGRDIRDTDLIGHTDPGTLALVLLDAECDVSGPVINRLISRLEDHEFPTATRIALGVACYPADAVDAGSLKRQALARPIVKCRGRAPKPAEQH